MEKTHQQCLIVPTNKSHCVKNYSQLSVVVNHNFFMQVVQIPQINISVSRFGFGTASLHHLFSSGDRQTLLETAFDNGFTHFDTAPLYGDGMAERELGTFLVGKRDKITIGNKFGLPPIAIFERFPPFLYGHRALGKIGRKVFSRWDQRPRDLSLKGVQASLNASLNRLNTDYIDLFFLHEPSMVELDQIQTLAPWLEQQKTNGTVRYLGLAGNVTDCLAIAEGTDNLFDVLQVEDSLEQCQADKIIQAGKPLQITFGYLRQAMAHSSPLTPDEILQRALARNPDGMVLVSSRRGDRLGHLASLAR